MMIRRGSKGFSLLEIVIALVLLTVGLVGVLYLFPVGLRASGRAGLMSKAAFFAQRKLEDIKREGYDFHSTPGLRSGVFSDDKFSWEEKVENPLVEGEPPEVALRKIILTVQWVEEGAKRSEDFVTYIVQPY